MSSNTVSTRRALLKGGAVLAAPLAVAAPAAAMAEDAHKARLRRLEDEAAVRDLHMAWLRRVNTGAPASELFADPRAAGLDPGVRAVAADHAAAPDTIAVAADGLSATGLFHCAIEIESEIRRDSTLAQMAHAQGGGVVRRAERRLLEVRYVKTGGAWAIERLSLA